MNEMQIDRLAELAAQTAAPLFHLYGWTYGENEIPDFYKLKNTIIELINHLLEHPDTDSCSTGRFTVERTIEEDDDEVEHERFKVYLEVADTF